MGLTDKINGMDVPGENIAPPVVSPAAFPWRRLVLPGLVLIIILGAFLRFYHLGESGYGNMYYAATVRSMLTSWHNFFYASFEPGGSVAVDKPPLGFWLQAVSASFLGVSGFSLALPQALAGVLSIPLLFWMVRRPFGKGAGLLAALALAVMPVTVATERNNTVDGTLVFMLLLAAWAALRAARLGQLRWLLLSFFLVGLGFNIKMLQAYMALPALVAVYFLGAPLRWYKRILHLAAASLLLLLAVSFAWVAAVDLTPATQRPFVGSSPNNTVMGLILGHNGLSRLGLANLTPSVIATVQGANPTNPGGQPAPAAGDQPNRPLQPVNPPGQPQPNPPNPQPQGQVNNQRANEVGWPGLSRLFTQPLAQESSWLLPLALLGIPLTTAALRWKWPWGERQQSLLLWAVWLLPMLAYFSFTKGIWHAYYLIMLGPALAALTGMTLWAAWQVWQKRRWLGLAALALLAALTLAFQASILNNYPAYLLPVMIPAGAACLAGLILLAVRGWGSRLPIPAAILICLGLLLAPGIFSTLTALNPRPDTGLPNAGPDNSNRPANPTAGPVPNLQDRRLLDYLLQNAPADGYLAAATRSQEAAPLILATGRAVLTFGGFNGGDNVVTVERLAQLVRDGKLRFVFAGEPLQNQKPQLWRWVSQNCTPARLPGSNTNFNGQAGPLYDCARR